MGPSAVVLLPAPRRAGTRELLVVAATAACHVSATLTTKLLISAEDPPSPLFMTWFSTCWHIALVAPLALRSGRAVRRPSRAAALAVLPFYALFAGANLLYVSALASLDASLVMAIFGITPALVALLSVPALGQRLTPRALGAVALAAAGVLLIAEPWRRGAGGGGGGSGGGGTGARGGRRPGSRG